MLQMPFPVHGWQLAKYGEHVMNCPLCRPIEGRYCELAGELSAALYDGNLEHPVIVRQPQVIDIRCGHARRC